MPIFEHKCSIWEKHLMVKVPLSIIIMIMMMTLMTVMMTKTTMMLKMRYMIISGHCPQSKINYFKFNNAKGQSFFFSINLKVKEP